MSEFIEQRAARLLAQAEYLPEGSAEQVRLLALGNALCGQELSNEQRLIGLVRPITDNDPDIGWKDFVQRVVDELSDEGCRLYGGVPTDVDELADELRKQLFPNG